KDAPVDTPGVPTPPGFTSQPPSVGTVGAPLVYHATALDPNGRPLTYALAAGPAGMVVAPASGTLVWTPDPDQAGVQHVLGTARGASPFSRSTSPSPAGTPRR